MNEDFGHNLRDRTIPAYQDEQRKLIDEFLDFFVGGKDFYFGGLRVDLFEILGGNKENLIDDFFKSRK
jgi:hypothetical protein